MTEFKAGHLIAMVEFPQVQNSTHVQNVATLKTQPAVDWVKGTDKNFILFNFISLHVTLDWLPWLHTHMCSVKQNDLLLHLFGLYVLSAPFWLLHIQLPTVVCIHLSHKHFQ